jgi:hypothetical protein
MGPKSETMMLFPFLDLEVDGSSQTSLGRQILGPTWFFLHISAAYGTRAPLAPHKLQPPGLSRVSGGSHLPLRNCPPTWKRNPTKP